jgi:biotin carboxylase
VKKAKEMGLYTIVFSWPKGTVCDKYADEYYPISVVEHEKIAEVCRREHVDAVTSLRSDVVALATAKVAEKLNLPGTSSKVVEHVLDKAYVRQWTKDLEGLSTPWIYTLDVSGYDDLTNIERPLGYPCVVKPNTSCGKKGVSFCKTPEEYFEAVRYAATEDNCILVEQYIGGSEISVETISYGGKHYVLQITDKDNTGAPHFVELGQHEPANISEETRRKVQRTIKRILTSLEYNHGLAHVEMKIVGDHIYLIEINPRGGGSFISDRLVNLSTGYDLIKATINLALDSFEEPQELHTVQYAGMYWLSGNEPEKSMKLRRLLSSPWVVDYHIGENVDQVFTTNVERDSYVIYHSNHKITV